MMPFEWGVDSRHAAKDAFREHMMSGPLETLAKPAICGKVYLDPAVPVARPGGKSETNVLSGIAAQAPMGAPARFQPRDPAAATLLSDSYVDKTRAMTGILASPPPFTAGQ
jgi:hypothetical protein